MMNFSFFDVVLNHWLSDDLIGWNLDSLLSVSGVVLSLLNDWVHLNSSIFLSLELHINIFSLNDWLNISLVVNFLSRSGNILSSSSFLKNWFSHNWFSGFILRFRFLEVNSFSVVDDLSLDDRLSVVFFGRGLDCSVNSFFREIGWSGLDWHIVNTGFSSINLELDIFSENGWLNVLLSDGSLSWNINRN